MGNTPDLNISLEPHLLDVLVPLSSILPPTLVSKLAPFLQEPTPPTIPYDILHAISQWSRTPVGLTSLQSQSPPLDPHAYAMIALLSGTTTSPERKFAEYIPQKEPEELAAEQKKERKAITALLNALLSIGGSGFATWWAADKTGWRNEWRVLLSLFVAIVVAISEAVLYIIWQSRRSKSKSVRRTRRRIISAKYKKDDGNNDRDVVADASAPVTDEQERFEGLRQRTAIPKDKNIQSSSIDPGVLTPR